MYLLTATDMDMDIVEVTVGCIVSRSRKSHFICTYPLYDIIRKLPDGSEIKVELLDTKY